MKRNGFICELISRSVVSDAAAEEGRAVRVPDEAELGNAERKARIAAFLQPAGGAGE